MSVSLDHPVFITDKYSSTFNLGHWYLYIQVSTFNTFDLATVLASSDGVIRCTFCLQTVSSQGFFVFQSWYTSMSCLGSVSS